MLNEKVACIEKLKGTLVFEKITIEMNFKLREWMLNEKVSEFYYVYFLNTFKIEGGISTT